ncbi:MAG TPA: cytochrome C oxidase subunit II [Burkholderiaceae bacterium]|jgi:cytochrome c oxidase subunit II|nr:cytochrome C oxidase subunit II [Burkholderiaceae bacterium]
MSAIQPPSERLWWKQPVHRVEIVWITIALIWCLVMFFMMPYWHVYGRQNLSTETYRVKPEMFARAAQEMVDKFTVRTDEASGFPVVAPPAGSDVYLVARLWDWWPILELEKDKSYRLHLTAMDYQHGFSLQPSNINIQVLPGYQHVITITPDRAGTYAIVCNEFCGIGHHRMVSKLYVK